MPVHWEPGSFEEFRRAVKSGRCQIVLLKWTREWARNHGWRLGGLRFSRQFVRRVTASEQDFWLAYKDGAFDLHLREPYDLWGRPQ